MARRPESAGAPQTRLVWKLMTSAAIVSVAAACTPLTRMSGQKASLPAINYSQKDQTPAQPTNPLFVATSYWAKQYRTNPNDPNAALNYARNLKAVGAKSRVLAILKRAYAIHPNNPDIASEYGRAVLENGQTRLALRILKKAEKPDGKTDWRVLSAKGTAHAKLGEHILAQQYFISAMRKNPGGASLRNNLALSYAMSGKANRAETLLRQTIDSGHDTPRLRQNLALVLGLQRKFTEAEQIASVDLAEDKAQANVNYLRTMVRDRPAGDTPKDESAEDTPLQIAAAPPPKRKPADSNRKKASKPKKRQLTSATLPLPWAKKAPETTGSITPASHAGPVPVPARKPRVVVAAAKQAAEPVSNAKAASAAPAKSAKAKKPQGKTRAKPATARPWKSDVKLSAWQTTVEPERPKARKAVFRPFAGGD